MARLKNSISSNTSLTFMYIHIPKTGGSSLRSHLTQILVDAKYCNKMFKLPFCCWSGRNGLFSPITEILNERLPYPTLGEQCNFLDFEWNRTTMERELTNVGYNLTSLQLLSSFREPLSHFLSAYQQMHTRDLGQTLPLDQFMESLENNTDRHNYDLRNFQIKFMVHTNNDSEQNLILTEAITYMRSLYWFSILEQYQLSLKLLMCQVYGKVNIRALKKYTSKTYNVRYIEDNFEYKISPLTLSHIKKLTKMDTVFYNYVVVEFYRRVKLHSVCLNVTLPL